MKLDTDTKLIGLAALAGIGLIWWATRPGVAGKAAAAAVGAVGDAAVGTVKGIGSLVGVPDTNMTQCQKDLAAGNWWDASFSCPAGDYLSAAYGAGKGAVFGSTAVTAAEAADARREYAARDPRRLDIPQPTYDPLVTDSGMDFRYF